MIGRPGYKRRAWQAYISVSASGPEFSSELEERGYHLRPRLAADLRYTTADVEFFAHHWRQPHYDSGNEEFHVPQLRNPDRSELVGAFLQAGEWLEERSLRTDWDGGHITFTFAGHGRDADGALVLEDQCITASDLHQFFLQTAERWDATMRLRIVVILDSCYSGRFLMDLLDLSLHEHRLRPDYLVAGCMPDEVAWEESGLGHGVFTYSWSVRPAPHQPPFGGLAALAVQPDNSFGPSLDVASGPIGCSILTLGRQNPLAYSDGRLNGVSLHENPKDALSRVRPTRDIISRVLADRDEIRQTVDAIQPHMRVGRYAWTDAEMRREIRSVLQSAR